MPLVSEHVMCSNKAPPPTAKYCVWSIQKVQLNQYVAMKYIGANHWRKPSLGGTLQWRKENQQTHKYWPFVLRQWNFSLAFIGANGLRQ